MKEITSYAPVLIPTLCRYEHFRRCLESLSSCSLAGRTEVYIGLDYPAKDIHWEGYRKIKTYLESCGNLGFKNLIVFVREKNYGIGPTGNGRLLIDEVGKKYDRYIYSEDDNEFSPSFLVFQNLALEKYKDENRVTHICAYTPAHLQGVTDASVFCTVDCPAYGVGHWNHKQKLFAFWDYKVILKTIRRRPFHSLKLAFDYPALMNQLVTMIKNKKNYGDLRYASYNLFHNTFCICPSVSLSRNWGCDGTGEHSGVKTGVKDLKISSDIDFDLVDIDLRLPNRYKKIFSECEAKGLSLLMLRCCMLLRIAKLIIDR